MEARVGVGAFILNDKGQVLLGKRKGSHGAGEWSLPGGHLEFKETIEACCRREVKEETGLTELGFLSKLGYSEDFFIKEGKHYVTTYMLFRLIEGVPELKEPNKCEGWRWFDISDAPSPLFCGTSGQLSEVERLKKLLLSPKRTV